MAIEVADLVVALRASDDGFQRGMEVAGAAVEGLHKHTQSTLKSIQELGVGFGAAALGGIAEMVRKASDFQAVTQHLANNTNMGAVGLDAMREASLKLAAQTGQDSAAIAEGYMHVANHAYSGAAAFNVMAAAAKNAAAAGGDANENGNILSGILREMNVSNQALAQNADLATRYMDTLHNAVANSNFSMKDFAEGSKRAIAGAAAFGVPLSQVSAQLALLSEHGFPNVQNASTNWIGMLRALEKPTSAATKAMAEYSNSHVNLLDDVQRLRKDGSFLPQFLADIAKATAGDPTKLMAIMPRSSYEQVLQALIRNKGQLDQIQKLTGAAQAGIHLPGMTGTDEAFAAEQKTLMGQMQDLNQSMNAIAVHIGTVLIPPLTKIVTALNPVIQSFGAWADKHQQFIVGIMGAGVAIGALSAASMAAGPALAVLTGPIGLVAAAGVGLYEAWSHNIGGIQGITEKAWGAVKPVFDAMGGAIGTLQGAFSKGGMGGAFASLPGTLKPVEAALAGLGGKIMGALNGIDWNGIGTSIRTHVAGWASAYWSWATHVIGVEAQYLGPLALRLNTWIVNTAGQLRTQLLAWAVEFVNWVGPHMPQIVAAVNRIGAAVLTYVRAAVTPIAEQLQTWGGAFVTWVEPKIGPLVNALGGLLSRLGSWIVNDAAPVVIRQLSAWGSAFIAWVQPHIQPMLNEAGHLLGQLGTWITGPAATAVETHLKDWGGKLVAWIGPHIQPMLHGAGNLLNQFGTWITGPAANAIGQKLNEWGTKFIAWIVPATAQFLNDWPHHLNDFLKVIHDSAQTIAQRLGAWAGAFVNWIQANDVIPKLGKAFLLVNAAIIDFIGTSVAVIATNLGMWAAEFIGWLDPKGTFDLLVPSLKLFAGSIGRWIVAEAKTIGKAALDMGGALVDGLKKGIEDKGADLAKFISKWATDHVPAPMRWAMQILSPSKVTQQIGWQIGDGLALGITDRAKAVWDAATTVAAGVALTWGQAFTGQTMTQMARDAWAAFTVGFSTAAKEHEGAVDITQGIVQGVLGPAGAALSSGESKSTIATAIATLHTGAAASALPSVQQAHASLGHAATAALAASITAGTSPVVSAVNGLVAAATAAGGKLVDNFAAISAEAAKRLANLASTGNINGIVAGQQAPVPPVFGAAAAQAAITPTVHNSANAALTQTIATGGGTAAQQAAYAQALDMARKMDPQAWQQHAALLGQLLAAGIAQGLSASTDAQEALYTLNAGLQDQMKTIWDMHSPSKVAHEYGKDIVAGLAEGVKDSADAATGAVGKLMEQMKGAMAKGASEAAKGPAGAAAAAMADPANILSAIAAGFQGGPAGANSALGISGAITGPHLTPDLVASTIQTALQSLVKTDPMAGMAGLADKITATAANGAVSIGGGLPFNIKPDQIQRAIADAFSHLSTGINQGLASGLSEGDAVTQAMAGLNAQLLADFKGFWGISSPSSVMHDHGRNMVAGLMGGIRASQADAQAVMAALLKPPTLPAAAMLTPSAGIGGSSGGGGGSVTNITVTIAPGGVTVSGHDDSALGQKIGQAVNEAVGGVVRGFVAAARTTAPPRDRLLPGAISTVPR